MSDTTRRFHLLDLTLRPVTRADAPQLFAWRRSEPIARMMLSPPPATYEAHLAYLDRVLASPLHAFHLLEHRGKPVGHVGFSRALPEEATSDWTIYVGAPDAPRGTGTALGLLTLDAHFAAAGRCAVETLVIAENTRSLQLHERLGFSPVRGPVGNGPEVVTLRLDAARWRAVRPGVAAALFGDAL